MSAPHADQAARRHGSVVWLVGQSQGRVRFFFFSFFSSKTMSTFLSETSIMRRCCGEAGLTRFYSTCSLEGEGGQHGQGLPAQETRAAAADLRGHGRAAGGQRGRLQRGEDQQRRQQGEDHVCRQQGAERRRPDVSRGDVNDSLIVDRLSIKK